MVWYNVTGVAEIPYTMAMELRAAQVGSRKIDNIFRYILIFPQSKDEL